MFLGKEFKRNWWCIRENLESRIKSLDPGYWKLEAGRWKFVSLFFSLFSILLLLSSNQLHSQTFDGCKLIEQESQKFKTHSFLKSLPSIAGYDVKAYQLDIELNPSFNYISGSVMVQFEVRSDSMEIFQLLLADSMQVDSIVYHEQSLTYEHSNRVIRTNLPSPIFQNSIDTIRIYYQGSPASGGLGTFVQDTISATDTMIWTLSQPYGASEWFPCKDDLYDKADSIEIRVTTPLGYKVAANGIRMSIDTLGSNHRYHYKSSYPIATYLIAVAVANYQFIEEQYPIGNDTLLIEHYLFQDETLQQSNDPLYEWMLLFDSLFGEYPFINEKYGHASFTRGGGMEHQTMSFMGGYGGELIAHELAHQWFGNKITCSSWQDLWLNEGFAVYLTGLTYEFNVIHDSLFWPVVLDLWKRDAFLYPDQAVFREDTTDVSGLFNQVAYQKGASVLHMLRWVCGDSAFFAGVKNYINDPQWAYGFVSTDDLKYHLEQSSGKDLTEFFKDWIYGKGYPIYTSNWSQEDGQVQVEIEQIPSHPSVYFFNTPLPYQLHSGSWDSTIILDPRFSGEIFDLNIGRTLDSISFDPEGWILAKNDVLSSLEFINKDHLIELNIFPNPNSGVFSIEVSQELLGFPFQIYDLNSRLIMESHFNKNRKSVDLNIEKGVYFLSIPEKGIQRKLVIY